MVNGKATAWIKVALSMAMEYFRLPTFSDFVDRVYYDYRREKGTLKGGRMKGHQTPFFVLFSCPWISFANMNSLDGRGCNSFSVSKGFQRLLCQMSHEVTHFKRRERTGAMKEGLQAENEVPLAWGVELLLGCNPAPSVWPTQRACVSPSSANAGPPTSIPISALRLLG